jgi:hypothetical protein
LRVDRTEGVGDHLRHVRAYPQSIVEPAEGLEVDLGVRRRPKRVVLLQQAVVSCELSARRLIPAAVERSTGRLEDRQRITAEPADRDCRALVAVRQEVVVVGEVHAEVERQFRVCGPVEISARGVAVKTVRDFHTLLVAHARRTEVAEVRATAAEAVIDLSAITDAECSRPQQRTVRDHAAGGQAMTEKR